MTLISLMLTASLLTSMQCFYFISQSFPQVFFQHVHSGMSHDTHWVRTDLVRPLLQCILATKVRIPELVHLL